MKYTIFDDISVDQQIDEHMNLITTEIKNILGKNLYSIILTGGFGRGEGSILIKEKNQIQVINDYDFEIIYKPTLGELISKIYIKTKYTKALSALETKLAKIINIKQLDFTLRSLNDYKLSTTPRLADYDTKYGHIVLYGDDPTLSMPQYESYEIPLFEGSWLLRNRGIGLLLAYFYLSRDKKPTCQATDNFYIEINKALLAMGDALFIINKNYHHSYQSRLNAIDSLKHIPFNRMPELINLYKIAAEHKLKPKNDTFSNYKANDLWHLVTDLYIDLFIWFESTRLDIKIDNINQYAQNYSLSPKVSFKDNLRILYELVFKKIGLRDIPLARVIRNQRANLSFTLSLLAYLHDRKKHHQLIDIIKEYSHLPSASCDEICKKYLLLSHPSGELKRFLGNPMQ